MLERYFIRGLEFKWMYPGSDESGTRDGSIDLKQPKTSSFNYQGMSGDIFDFGAPNVRTLGLTIGTNVSFNWLDYKPGHTTKVQLTNDTMTGFMSGCPVATWTELGVRYMGHVGTDVGRDAMNTLVKQQFLAAMTNDTVAFNPGGEWTPGEIAPLLQKLQKPGGPGRPAVNYRQRTLALVTTGGIFYAILVFNKVGTHHYVVGGIKQVAPTSNLALRAQLA